MPNWRKELEHRAELAEERAADAERRVAFYEARLDGLNATQMAGLLAVHEGPMTGVALRGVTGAG
jgi:hypothetical protein